MNKIFGLMLLVCQAGCWGNSSVDNEVVGQVKKVTNETPLFCSKRNDLDMSLGVMRPNGTGSFSTQDVMFTVPNFDDSVTLNNSITSGKLVKVHFDEARLNWCWQDKVVTKVEVLSSDQP